MTKCDIAGAVAHPYLSFLIFDIFILESPEMDLLHDFTVNLTSKAMQV